MWIIRSGSIDHRSVEWCQMPTQIRKVDQPVDRVQHVIGRHEFIEAEYVEKCSPTLRVDRPSCLIPRRRQQLKRITFQYEPIIVRKERPAHGVETRFFQGDNPWYRSTFLAALAK
jgi:hypothetical protein